MVSISKSQKWLFLFVVNIDIRCYYNSVISIFDILGVIIMARGKFSSLTEQMVYVLMSLNEEKCGIEITEWICDLTCGRVNLGPGTLYTILSQFLSEGLIVETKQEGRKRNYQITDLGMQLLKQEKMRLINVLNDLNKFLGDDHV